MDTQRANDLAAHLRACFRTMSPEQQNAIARNFELHEPEPVFEAIQRHVGKHEFVNGAALFADIDTLSVVHNRDKRKASAEKQVDQRRQKIEDEQHEVEANMTSMYLAVQRLSPEARERHKAAVISELEKSKSFVAERLRDKDPQTSPMLASLIARRIGGVS